VDDSTTIYLDDLERVVERCLLECRNRFGASVELGADYYWLIEPSEAFDLDADPSPNAGQLTDDIATIRAAAANGDPLASPSHELGHALGVLNRLAYLLASEPD
jgi:hypothetical protein